MVPETKRISDCLIIKAVKTDIFKTERISIAFTDKIDRRNMPLSALAFSILKRGTKRFPTLKDLNKRLDDLYATSITTKLRKVGKKYYLGYNAEMLGANYVNDGEDILDGVIELIHEMIFNPLLVDGKFKREYFESEKENVIDTINAQINNPRAYASTRCVQIMYKNDEISFDPLGTVDMVKGFTFDDVNERYRFLVSNLPLTVFYVGSRDIADVEEIIKKYFFDRQCKPLLNEREPVDFSLDTVRTKYVKEKMNINQGKLVMGYKSGTNITCGKEFYAMLVFNEIFGWSPISKLFMNVRERLGLCYYCSSVYSVYKGAIFVSSGICPADKGKVENEIRRQLKEIQKGNVSNEEFSAAVKSLLNEYSEIYDSPAKIEDYYVSRDTFGINDTIDDCKTRIRAVTLSEVIEVARKIKLDTVYFLCGEDE